MFLPRLEGPVSSARRISIVCEPADWAKLLEANGGIAPCATAAVATGHELLASLASLQLVATRVLVTVAANISLPTSPSPQRLDPAPDDLRPLVSIYRNTTIVGLSPASAGGLLAAAAGNSSDAVAGAHAAIPGASSSGTELNLGKRRNAFGLANWTEAALAAGAAGFGTAGLGGTASSAAAAAAAAWQQQQKQQQPVLVVSDLHLVNLPSGPLSSWPAGLVLTQAHYAGLDRRYVSACNARSITHHEHIPLLEIVGCTQYYTLVCTTKGLPPP